MEAGLLSLRQRVRGPVARGTIFWCGLVEQDRLGGNNTREFVALCALYVLMGAAQGEVGPRVVIEQRRFPLHAGMAFCAASHFAFGELFTVNVFVAIFALRWHGLEVDVDELGFEIRRLVAVDASGRTVCAQQWELGFRMIEA